MPSGRALRNRSFALSCLAFLGSCDAAHVSSSVGESVLCVSESRAVSHSASMVHVSMVYISSILLSFYI